MKPAATIPVVVLSILSALSVAAQEFRVEWFTLDDGGGTSSGGLYSIGGTIGQQDAGWMSGGDYALEGGFWSIAGMLHPGEPPLLRITLGVPNSVIISWPAPAPGWVLQQSSSAGPSASWADIGTSVVVNGPDNTVRQSLADGSRFYRLRHP